MPKWKCPSWGCDVWAYAPKVRPVHKGYAKDPHCPVHNLDLEWTDDAPAIVQAGPGSKADDTPTRDAKNGIRVATFAGVTPIYCDFHQRKHILMGLWPGNVKPDKPLFLSEIFNQENLGLGVVIATTIDWSKVQKGSSGIDAIIDCGNTVVGTKDETDILVQGGWSGDVITFHAYPIEKSGTQAKAFSNAKNIGHSYRIVINTRR